MTESRNGDREIKGALAESGRFSARRALVLGFGGVLVLVAGLLGWSVLASISGAVIASGLVEVESGNQVVAHIEGGTVSEILVRDGDHRLSRPEDIARLLRTVREVSDRVRESCG